MVGLLDGQPDELVRFRIARQFDACSVWADRRRRLSSSFLTIDRTCEKKKKRIELRERERTTSRESMMYGPRASEVERNTFCQCSTTSPTAVIAHASTTSAGRVGNERERERDTF